MKRLQLHLVLFFLGMLVGQNGYSQNDLSLQSVTHTADSLYLAKNYISATAYYIQVAALSDFNSQKANATYNAACCLALQNKQDSALLYLKKAIHFGFNNRKNMLADKDLISLHNRPEWNALLASVEESKGLNNDPAKTKFITTDIHHFWEAWDAAYGDTAHFRSIFKKLYFDRASRGMNDYMALKVESIDYFIQHIQSAPRFYAAIRKNMLMIDQFKPQFYAAFQNFKKLYSAATFPDVYFIIGAFTSGGTVSGTGLLLGVNQASQSDDTPLDELSERMKTRLNKVALVPNVVAHELIHFQQDGMKGDTITLGYAINEGMADFLGERISGRTGNPNLFAWAKGKEAAIWERFTKDMYLNRYNNWIANSKGSTADNPPDQGYWVGYQICKAYYDKAKNKKQAVYDMLHIQDYRRFLKDSGWEQKVARMKKK